MELKLEHKQAAHCENGTVSALLRYYGINLSEPMVFGLSSGLFFTHLPFVKLSGMPVTSFRTFPGVFFSRITKLLGIKRKTKRFFNQEKAMSKLDELLKRGIPVGCVVGMYYLPYVPIEYRFHFNGHNICVIGKDEKSGDYTVLDSNITQKVTISSKDLQTVRFAKGGTYPLMGQMYWIEEVPKELPNMKLLILKSIRKTSKLMAYTPVHIVGAKGIIYLSKRIRKWEKKMGRRRALLNLAQIVRMLEEIGTGGAGFRFIYGAFLQEASQKTGIEEFNAYSQRITEIGDMWRDFAYKISRMFKKRSTEENYTFDQLGDMLQAIGEKELSFFKELYAVSKQYLR